MKHTTLLSASIAVISCLSLSAFNRSLFTQINIFSNQALHKKQFIKNVPAEIYDIFFKRIKDGRSLTTSEAFARGIAVLESKKYEKWKQQNEKAIPSVMDSFYETHFGCTSNATDKQKITDAIDVLRVIKEIPQEHQLSAIKSLALKLDAFLMLLGISDLEQYVSSGVEGLPLDVHDVFFNKIKNGKSLTTSEALAKGIALLKSKKYKSWAQKNKKVILSAMDSFYELHFGYKSNKTSEEKVADAIEILYGIQGELDYQPLAEKLKKLLTSEEKDAVEQYFLDSVKGFPLEIHTILFLRKKDGKNLTIPEALAEGIALLKSKKYKSWAQKNKKVILSVIDSCYELHFGYKSNKTSEEKVADAIEILYGIQGELDYQPLVNKLKSLLTLKEASAVKTYVENKRNDPNYKQRIAYLITIVPFIRIACESTLSQNDFIKTSFLGGIRKRYYTI